jgi:hypothetical protein
MWLAQWPLDLAAVDGVTQHLPEVKGADKLLPSPAVCGAAAWVEKGREAISACLREATGLSSITWRPAADMLKEEGCGPGGARVAKPAAAAGEAQEGEGEEEAGETEAAAQAGAAAAAEVAATEASTSSGSSSGDARVGAPTVVVTENGIKFEAAPLGQKTGEPLQLLLHMLLSVMLVTQCGVRGSPWLLHQQGSLLPAPFSRYPACPAATISLLACCPATCPAFPAGFYADQRDSRAAVRQLAGGLRVLDLCCYTGGFALSAAAGGAAAVVGVDSSPAAVDLAGRNAELNGLAGVCGFVKADVTDFMKQVGGWAEAWVDGCVFDGGRLSS